MDYYIVGRIVNTHGIRGEVRVLADTDFADERFVRGNKLYIFNKNELVEAVEIEQVRLHKNFYLLTFKGKHNINLVEGFKQMVLKISADQQQPLEDGFYHHQIIGLKAIDEQGQEVGSVKAIFNSGATDIWTIKRNGDKDIMIPYIDEYVGDVDLEAGTVVLKQYQDFV